MKTTDIGRLLFRPISQVLTGMVVTGRLSDVDAEAITAVVVDRLQELGWTDAQILDEVYEYRHVEFIANALRNQGVTSETPEDTATYA